MHPSHEDGTFVSTNPTDYTKNLLLEEGIPHLGQGLYEFDETK